MAIIVASAELRNEDFLAAFSSYKLPLASFRHGDHLRLAGLQLHRDPFDEALTLVREGIQRYAAYNGLPGIYHETVTTAWVKLLSTHREASFPEFIRVNEHRLTRRLLHRFWTADLLDSEVARRTWVPPDCEALPD